MADSNYLEAKNFGFSLPSTAVVLGIAASVTRYSTGSVTDALVKLIIGGSQSGSDKSTGATWASSPETVTFGGSSDLWGSSLAYSDVNASNFGVAIECSGTGTAYVDHVEVTVYYKDFIGSGCTLSVSGVASQSSTVPLVIIGPQADDCVVGTFTSPGGDLYGRAADTGQVWWTTTHDWDVSSGSAKLSIDSSMSGYYSAFLDTGIWDGVLTARYIVTGLHRTQFVFRGVDENNYWFVEVEPGHLWLGYREGFSTTDGVATATFTPYLPGEKTITVTCVGTTITATLESDSDTYEVSYTSDLHRFGTMIGTREYVSFETGHEYEHPVNFDYLRMCRLRSSEVVSLYVSGAGPEEATMPLYASGGYPNANVDLFVGGSIQDEANIDLFVQGIGGADGNMPLFISSLYNASDSTDLFITGSPYSSLSLVILGHDSQSSSSTLFVNGCGQASQNADMYICGVLVKSSGLPLYLQADEIPVLESGLRLELFGSTGEGNFSGIPLYITSDTWPHDAMNLYISGPLSETVTSNMNLFVAGQQASSQDYVTLVAWNNVLGKTASTPLLISGEGGSDGALPYGDSLNLFLRRDPSNAIPMVIFGPGYSLNGSVAMNITGGNAASQSATLVIPSVVGEETEQISLYTHGF